MNVGFYATKIQAAVMRAREKAEVAYQEYADAELFWGFIDLVGSSNFRITHGPMEGYVRGETFFTLIREVIAPCVQVRLIKEIGDAVLLSSSELRALLECVVLTDQTTAQLAAIAGTEAFPFGIRIGIGYGPAKRLMRHHEDFLGTAIDQLARIMAVRSSISNILVHAAAFASHEAIFDEYKDFLTVGSPKQVLNDKSKGMLSPVLYREVTIERKALLNFRKHFSPWRLTNEKALPTETT